MNLQPGKYVARPLEAALGFTKKSGTPQVAVLFELEGGGAITWYGYFTEKTEELTIKALRTCGWKGDDLSDLRSIGGAHAPQVQLTLEEESDAQGVVRMRVRWVNPVGLALQDRMPPDQAKAFARQMYATVRRCGASAEGPSPPARVNGHAPALRRPPAGAGDAYEGDDLPF